MRHLREQVGTAAPQELRRLRDCARRDRKKERMSNNRKIARHYIEDSNIDGLTTLFDNNDITANQLLDKIAALEALLTEAEQALGEFDVEEPIGIPWQWQSSFKKARATLAKLKDR